MDCKASHRSFSRSCLLLTPLLAATLAGCQQGQPPTAARTLYLNGKIHTQDGQRQVAERRVVSGDQFLYVG
ncbi:MAG: amidohydrolase, partial [Aeromonadaceae bacterium]|nr:amidohydrolase [Aeromonadaceae bacterium]